MLTYYKTNEISFGPTSVATNGAAVTDIDGDGWLEVTAARYTFPGGVDLALEIWEATADGSFVNATSELVTGPAPVQEYGRAIVAEDVNGDGQTDIIIGDHGFDAPPFPGAPNLVLLSNGQGKLENASARFTLGPDFTHSTTVGDVDGDGRKEILFGNYRPASGSVMATVTADGTAEYGVLNDAVTDITGYATVYMFDVDGDGDDEIFLGADGEGPETRQRSALLDWTGTAFERTELPLQDVFSTRTIALSAQSTDLNGDGHLDLVVARTNADPWYTGWSLQALLQTETGGFEDQTERYFDITDFGLDAPMHFWLRNLLLHDMNGDGRDDLVLDMNQLDNKILLRGEDGRFTDSGAQIGTTSVAVLDYDRDGVDEVVTLGGWRLEIFDTDHTQGFDWRTSWTPHEAPKKLDDIRDYDGNDLGASEDWRLIGQVDAQFDGDVEFIFVNPTIGRWATVGTNGDGKADFTHHGAGGDTRIVGIYIDPLVQSGEVEKFSDHDSQKRFQNDLQTDNLTVIDAFDFDGDGFQEIYFKVNDGTAYLRALMHADGNIQYANYQNAQQVDAYLTGQGFDQNVLDTILV